MIGELLARGAAHGARLAGWSRLLTTNGRSRMPRAEFLRQRRRATRHLDKPLRSEVGSPGTSRISDQEMARVNIEASAALADWVDIYRSDPGGGNYVSLVNRAVSYLPMPRKTSALEMTELWALADAAMATRVVEAAGAERLARVRADAGRGPSRVFANALVNSAWRNGPVENLHAGESRGYPIHCRRFAPSEERELMVTRPRAAS